MINRTLVTLVLLLSSMTFYANNLTISNVSLSGDQLNFDVEWDNSWRASLEFHDAVWIFIKQAPNGGRAWQHCKISAATGLTAGFEADLPADHVGVFIRRSSNGNGTSTTSVQVTLENQIGMFQDIKVFGVEMVYVPQGDFFAGDGVSNARIRRGDDDSKSVKVTSEAALGCGPTSSDISFGSSCVDLDANYPKGYAAYYTMKYSITQNQYVDFLNCISRDQQENHIGIIINGNVTTVTDRYIMAGASVPTDGNGVRCDASIGTGNINFYCDLDADGIANEANDGLSRAMNYLCPADWAAYLDWSGLRPMSFLEYEKACRGPLAPIPNEQSWGSTLTNTGTIVENVGAANEDYIESGTLGGIITYNKDVIRVGFNAVSVGATRELSNASYYGIIDLGNNPGDYYLDEDTGGVFTGNNGNGSLSLTGYADVLGWPAFDCAFFPFKYFGLGGSVSDMGFAITSRNFTSGGRGIRSL